MSGAPTLQHDDFLTQSEILEKETVPPAKEAYQHSEAEPEEATWSGFVTERSRDGSSYVIDFTAGWSFGEPHDQDTSASRLPVGLLFVLLVFVLAASVEDFPA